MLLQLLQGGAGGDIAFLMRVFEPLPVLGAHLGRVNSQLGGRTVAAGVGGELRGFEQGQGRGLFVFAVELAAHRIVFHDRAFVVRGLELLRVFHRDRRNALRTLSAAAQRQAQRRQHQAHKGDTHC